MGDCLRFLRRGLQVMGPGKYGYITQEREGVNTFFSFYLLVDGAWGRLTFRQIEGRADIYLAASSGTVVEVAIEEGFTRPRLQMLVENEGVTQWWLIYWWSLGGRVLVATIHTTLDPCTIVV